MRVLGNGVSMPNRSISSMLHIFIMGFIVPCFAGDIESALDRLAQDLLSQVTLDSRHTLAIMPFETKGSIKQDVGRDIAEYLVAIAQNHPSFELVDRMQFSKVMEELALSQSGAIDESKAVEAGKALAAQYLLLGTASDALGKTMISARLVQTESAKIVATANVSLDPGALSSFAKELLGEQGQVSASLFRSMVVPGWGQLYTKHTLRGVLSLGLFAGGAGLIVYGVATTVQAGNDYDDFTEKTKSVSGEAELKEEFCGGPCTVFIQDDFNKWKSTRQDALYDEYESKRNRTIIFGAVTGGIWALNLVDAAIAGAQSRKKFKLYFSAIPSRELKAGISYAF